MIEFILKDAYLSSSFKVSPNNFPITLEWTLARSLSLSPSSTHHFEVCRRYCFVTPCEEHFVCVGWALSSWLALFLFLFCVQNSYQLVWIEYHSISDISLWIVAQDCREDEWRHRRWVNQLSPLCNDYFTERQVAARTQYVFSFAASGQKERERHGGERQREKEIFILLSHSKSTISHLCHLCVYSLLSSAAEQILYISYNHRFFYFIFSKDKKNTEKISTDMNSRGRLMDFNLLFDQSSVKTAACFSFIQD